MRALLLCLVPLAACGGPALEPVQEPATPTVQPTAAAEPSSVGDALVAARAAIAAGDLQAAMEAYDVAILKLDTWGANLGGADPDQARIEAFEGQLAAVTRFRAEGGDPEVARSVLVRLCNRDPNWYDGCLARAMFEQETKSSLLVSSANPLGVLAPLARAPFELQSVGWANTGNLDDAQFYLDQAALLPVSIDRVKLSRSGAETTITMHVVGGTAIAGSTIKLAWTFYLGEDQVGEEGLSFPAPAAGVDEPFKGKVTTTRPILGWRYRVDE